MAESSLPPEALASIRSHLSKVKVADSWTKVYKDECAICFDTPVCVNSAEFLFSSQLLKSEDQ